MRCYDWVRPYFVSLLSDCRSCSVFHRKTFVSLVGNRFSCACLVIFVGIKYRRAYTAPGAFTFGFCSLLIKSSVLSWEQKPSRTVLCSKAEDWLQVFFVSLNRPAHKVTVVPFVDWSQVIYRHWLPARLPPVASNALCPVEEASLLFVHSSCLSKCSNVPQTLNAGPAITLPCVCVCVCVLV